MGRTTVYNSGLVTDEKWEQVCQDNKYLLNEFLDYLKAADKSPQTIYQYNSQLRIVFVWLLENCDNKSFVNVKKREWVKFIGYLTSELKVSSSRIASIKSVMSSLSNFIETILDEDYPSFRNIIKIIPTPGKQTIREKTVLTSEQIDAGLQELVKKKKYQVACFFALLLASGMRRAEAIQMQVEDFTESNLVLHGIWYKTRPIRTKGKGVKGKILEKYVSKDIFQKYFDLWMQHRRENGIQHNSLFIVFKNGNYQQASISTANSWAETIEKVLGVPFYNHACRHYWTTKEIKGGTPESIIKELQGWAGLEMVSLYNDTSTEEQLQTFYDKQKEQEGD